MTPEEAFSEIDNERKGAIRISKLLGFIGQRITVMFKEREKYALANYLDYTKERLIDGEHFVREVQKAEEILRDPNVRDGLVIKKKRPIDGILAQTGTFDPSDFDDKPVDKEPGDKASQDIMGIVKRIERNQSLSTFLLSLLQHCELDGESLLKGDYESFLKNNCSSFLSNKDIYILTQSIDMNKDGEIDVFELRSFFKEYSSREDLLLEYNFKILAKIIDEKGISTCLFLTDKGVDINKKYSLHNFTQQITGPMLKLDLKESAKLFNEIDRKKEGLIAIRDFVEILNQFRTTKPTEPYSAKSKIDDAKEINNASPSTQATSAEELIAKINSSKSHGLVKLFQVLIEGNSNPKQGIDIDIVKESVSRVYNGFLSLSEICLLQDSLDLDENNVLTLDEIVTIVSDYVIDKKQKPLIHFIISACILDSEKAVTKDYFASIGIQSNEDYSIDEFTEKVSGPLLCDETSADYVFHFLSEDGRSVRGDDLIEAVETYRRFSPSKKRPSPKKEEHKPIVTEKEGVVEKVLKAMKENKMNASHIFSLGVNNGENSAPVIELKAIMERFLPDISSKDIFQLLRMLDTNNDGFVDRNEYEVIMVNDEENLSEWRESRASERAQSERSIGQSAHSITSGRRSGVAKEPQADSDAPYEWIRQLRSELESQSVNLGNIFSEGRNDDDSHEINIMALFWTLKNLLPSFPRDKIFSILRLLDKNMNGFVDKEEFQLLIQFNEKGEPLDQSIAYTEAEGHTAVSVVREALADKGMNDIRLFSFADANKDGLVNILDLKKAISALFQDGDLDHKAKIAFLAQVLDVFQEDNFDQFNFKNFMNEREGQIDHQDYNKKKDSIIESGGDSLASALEKIKGIIQKAESMNRGNSIKELMNRFDTDNDGSLDEEEFQGFIDSLDMKTRFSQREKSLLLKLADKDSNGVISINEFYDFIKTELKYDKLRKADKESNLDSEDL